MIYFVIAVALILAALLWRAGNHLNAQTKYTEEIVTTYRSRLQAILYEQINTMTDIVRGNDESTLKMITFTDAIAEKLEEILAYEDHSTREYRIKGVIEAVLEYGVNIRESVAEGAFTEQDVAMMRENVRVMYDQKK